MVTLLNYVGLVHFKYVHLYIHLQVCDVDTPECYILSWASALHLDGDHILQR